MRLLHTVSIPQGLIRYYNTPASGVLYMEPAKGVSVTQTSDGGLIVHAQTESFILNHNGTSLQVGREGSQETSLPSSTATITSIPPGSSIIIEQSAPTPSRGAYWDELTINEEYGRSVNQEAMALVQVPWGPQQSPVFRPPVLGTDALTQSWRDTPIFESDIDLTVLPSSVVLPVSAPSLAFLEEKFKFYSGDHYSGWSTDTRTPGFQHPGYGSYLAGLVSEAMTVLCSDLAMEDKRLLATRMCQWGLDLAGAFASGRENYMADGGHMLGRTPLLILTGKLLGVPALENPQLLFSSNLVEAEGNQYTTGEGGWWCAGSPNYVWAKHWSTSAYVSGAPSGWTSAEIFDFSYFDQTVGCQVGSMLALKLMGLENSMGVACREVIEWFMAGGPDAACKAELVAVGLNPTWGQSYSVGSGASNFCADAWNQIY